MDCSSNNSDNAVDSKQVDSLPFLMDHLPHEFRIKAEKELNETSEKKFESLKDLREMLKGEKTLEQIDFHGDFLQQFLRHNKYDVKKTLPRIKNFVHNVRNNPYYRKLSRKAFDKVKKSKFIEFLPKRAPDGSVILHVKYGNWDPRDLPLTDVNCYDTLLFQQCLRDQATQISGMTCILDCKDVSWHAIREFTPRVVRDTIYAFFNCVPLRYRAIHVINHPNPVKIVWAICRTVLTEKIKKRVMFHSNPEDLLEYMPPDALPTEYGGILKGELFESTMSQWLEEAFEHHKQCSLGGHSNYY